MSYYAKNAPEKIDISIAKDEAIGILIRMMQNDTQCVMKPDEIYIESGTFYPEAFGKMAESLYPDSKEGISLITLPHDDGCYVKITDPTIIKDMVRHTPKLSLLGVKPEEARNRIDAMGLDEITHRHLNEFVDKQSSDKAK